MILLYDRKYINSLKCLIEDLEKYNEDLEKYNECLIEDLKSKQNNILDLLEVNKEFCLEITYLRKKIIMLEDIIKKHEENECKLNTQLCKSNCQLNKIKKYFKVATGVEID